MGANQSQSSKKMVHLHEAESTETDIVTSCVCSRCHDTTGGMESGLYVGLFILIPTLLTQPSKVANGGIWSAPFSFSCNNSMKGTHRVTKFLESPPFLGRFLAPSLIISPL